MEQETDATPTGATWSCCLWLLASWAWECIGWLSGWAALGVVLGPTVAAGQREARSSPSLGALGRPGVLQFGLGGSHLYMHVL